MRAGTREGALVLTRIQQEMSDQTPSPLVPRDPPKGRVKYEHSTLPVLQKTETDAELATKFKEEPPKGG